MFGRTLLLLHFLGLLTACVFGQSVRNDQMNALPTTESIEIDGKLNEGVWQKAERVDQFVQRELILGQPSTERTEVAIVYDEHNLYIGVWAYDSQPEKIVAKELRRDFDYNLDDNFIVIIDCAFKDRCHRFTVNR